MNKVTKFYYQLGLKKAVWKSTLLTHGFFLLGFLFCICFATERSFPPALFMAFPMITLISINIFMNLCNSKGLPEGVELATLLEYYPFDTRCIYPLLAKLTMTPMLTFLVAIGIYTKLLHGTNLQFLISILVNVFVYLYVLLIYYWTYGRKTLRCKEADENLTNGLIASIGFFLVVFVLIYIVRLQIF